MRRVRRARLRDLVLEVDLYGAYQHVVIARARAMGGVARRRKIGASSGARASRRCRRCGGVATGGHEAYLIVQKWLEERLRCAGRAARLALVGAHGVEGVYGSAAWKRKRKKVGRWVCERDVR